MICPSPWRWARPESVFSALSSSAPVHIINRENISWLVESGPRFDYDMIVIDELSSFKSWQAKRFRSLLQVRPRVSRIVGLTGTPTSGGLMDLFAEYRILDMGQRLGHSITRYREAFFMPDKRSWERVFTWKLRPGAEKEIYRRIGDITMSMQSAEFLKMPECVMNRVSVRMSGEERKQYETLREQLILQLPKDREGGEAVIDAKNAAVLSGKLIQLAAGACYTETGETVILHDRKLDALEDLIEGAMGHPLLIAYWFQHDAQRLSRRFPGIRFLKSHQDMADWNAGKIPVAAIHPASAGHGLNLQAGGSTLIWFDLPWSLEMYQQTNARLWRQGQKAESVVIVHLITEDTIDENILSALERKDVTQQSLMNAVRARLKNSQVNEQNPQREHGGVMQ